jgi:hypothetical protein
MWVINGNCDLWTVQEGRFSLYHIPYPIEKIPYRILVCLQDGKSKKILITQDFQNKKKIKVRKEREEISVRLNIFMGTA